MKLFLKILNVFFVVLGVIFLIFILIGVYFWVADPYGIKPLITGTSSIKIEDFNNLEADDLLKKVTPQMSDCIFQKLGNARSMELMAGATPTSADLSKIAQCLQ